MWPKATSYKKIAALSLILNLFLNFKAMFDWEIKKWRKIKIKFRINKLFLYVSSKSFHFISPII